MTKQKVQKKASPSPVYLIDASIFIFRYYFSLPDNWFSKEGYPTAAVYGYTAFLLQLLEKHPPEVIAACYDQSLETCFRNEIYPEYKSSRALPDEALAFQLDACYEVAEYLGISAFGSQTYEADDLIGSLAKVARRSKRAIAILTRDKDLGQLLVRKQDYLWHPNFKQADHGERLYASDIQGKFGVAPQQLVDYLALVGDSIDDIPGVPGLGPKTVTHLLNEFGSLEGIFQHMDELQHLSLRGAKGLAEKLEGHTKQIAIARQLACIVDDIALNVKLSDLKWRKPDMSALADFCNRMGFERLLARAEKVLVT